MNNIKKYIKNIWTIMPMHTKKEKFWLYTKTGGEIYPAPVFLYLNRHSFHTVLQFK